MEHYQNKYIPILIDEIFEAVLTKEEIKEITLLRQLQSVFQNSTSNPTLKAISDVEKNFLEIFFDNENSKYDFGITKILKGEIFDITATSRNNKLGEFKSRNFKYETSLKDIYDELDLLNKLHKMINQ